MMPSPTQTHSAIPRPSPIPSASEAVALVVSRWWVVLLVTAVGAGLAIGGAQLFRPVYQAAALLRLKTPSQAAVGDPSQTPSATTGQDDPEEAGDPMQTVRRLKLALTSRSVLQRLVERHQQKLTAEELRDRNRLTEWVADHTDVDHRGGKNFRVRAKAHDPGLARSYTAFFAQEALEVHRSGIEQRAIAIESYAREQAKRSSAELKALEDRMVAFLERHPSLTIKGLNSDQVLTLEGTDRLRARARAGVLTRSLEKLAEGNPKLKQLLDRRHKLQLELRAMSERTGTTATSALTEALSEAKRQLAEAKAQGMKDDHPEVKQILRRIKELETRIAKAAPSAKGSDAAYEGKVRAELAEVDKEIKAESRAVGRTLPKEKEDLPALEEEWSKLRRQHQQISAQYTRLQEVAVNAALRKNLRLFEAKKMAVVVDEPRVPEAPTGLTRPLIAAAGSAASLGVGIFVALLLGLLDTRLRRPEDLSRSARGVEILAVLADHPMRRVKEALEAQQAALPPTGSGDDGHDQLASGEQNGESVIKWLKDTDDLDTALGLLKAPDEQGPDSSTPEVFSLEPGPSGEQWIDDLPTELQGRERRGAASSPRGGALQLHDPLLPVLRSTSNQGLPEIKVRTIASRAPVGPGLFVSTDPHSKAADQMRLLAARLQSQIGDTLRVVAVSSWEPQVGKTTVAANLAMVLAESQRRVLVIDACPGPASLTRTFGLEPTGAGLCEQLQRWLDGGSEPWEVVQVAETLTVLPATSVPRPALPLLSSEAFSRLVADMSQLYDALVLDTEGLERASDAVVLQKKVDGYVMVAARNRSTTRGLKEIYTRLDPKRILGVVFNEHEG
ncbi:MAG: hypothetical protein IT371_13575 [Deltaproteobacteria bacterium]|nr:hypothetical protein [Deltaproteobacteria bacterium]